MKREKIASRVRSFLQAQMRVACGRLKRFKRDERDEVVHDVRKTIKALRAALRLAEEMAPDRVTQAVAIPLRAAAHALGPMRDHLVLHKTAQSLSRRSEHLGLVQEAPRPADALKKAQTELQRASIALGRLLQEEFRAKGAKKGLRRIYQRARDAMHAASKEPSDEALHAWRRRAKDLQYVGEMLEGPKGWRRKIKRLTQLLGDDHDLATFLAQHKGAPSTAFGRLLAKARKRRRPLQKKAFRLGKELFELRPRDFVGRNKLLD